jgi:hypothetical protein
MWLITNLFLLVVTADFISKSWLTSAGQSSVTNAGTTQFCALKSFHNEAVCAVGSQPLMKFRASDVTCAFQCQHGVGTADCGGFNFRIFDNMCELYGTSQSTFDLEKGCRYFKVCKTLSCMSLTGGTDCS